MARKIIALEKVRTEYLGGVSKVKVYELINAGELKKVKIGRRSFITDESLDAYLERLAGGDAA